eukprot:7381152-Prymnesium_polylepis.2
MPNSLSAEHTARMAATSSSIHSRSTQEMGQPDSTHVVQMHRKMLSSACCGNSSKDMVML